MLLASLSFLSELIILATLLSVEYPIILPTGIVSELQSLWYQLHTTTMTRTSISVASVRCVATLPAGQILGDLIRPLP